MKPREPVDDGQQDLFRARLDQIIDMKHPKVVPAQTIDWDWPPLRLPQPPIRCKSHSSRGTNDFRLA